jgi:PKD repeat protein
MKKLYAFIWIAILALGFKANAQTTVACNAEFGIQLLNYNSVKFNPGTNADSGQIKHHWNFGDGSPVSEMSAPTHYYNQSGTYTVVHTVTRVNPNGVLVCSQSFTKQITITVPTCNLVADFVHANTASNPLTVVFQNSSLYFAASDSISWTFGDGGTSTAVNPTHTYTQSGTYTVCIRVKRNNPAGTSPCVKEYCKSITVTQPCNLQAYFSAQVSGSNPLSVSFQNQSQPASTTDAVSWTFGDGKTSNAYNPTHVYDKPGTYTVCLRVSRNVSNSSSPCVREYCKTITVTQPCNLIADFNWSSTGSSPLHIAFNNLSQPLNATDSIVWSFGDGTTSSAANPTHSYAQPGTYKVCLWIKQNTTISGTVSSCYREICKTITIIQPCELVVKYEAQSTAANSLQFKFTNTSTPTHPTDSIYWKFGDGTSLSGIQSDPAIANPTHTYAAAGNYTVCLRVKKNITNSAAACVREYCNNLVVVNPCNIQPNFKWTTESSNSRTLNFTNLTVLTTANAKVTWEFGDGSFANTWNASHQYTQPGKYYVCMKVQTSPTCIRVKCDSVIVKNPMPYCNSLSLYSFERTNTDLQLYKFKANHNNTALQYTWTFGDGTGATGPVAEHRYAKPGTYTACLTVWNGPNCASTTCKTIEVVQQGNCDTEKLEYSYTADQTVPNRLYFQAKSNTSMQSQVWTITRIPATSVTSSVVLNQNNPTYLFPDTGTYRVCLKASFAGNCVKEYCSTIHIKEVYNACVLQAYPNPVSSVVNVVVNLTEPETIHAYVYNMMNIQVKEKHQAGFTGNNIVSIDVNSLPAGIYTIKFVYGNKTCTTKFQKF